jgi:hypothetical protein
MEDFDLRNCTMALKVIDAFLDNQRGFRKTLGGLRGLIILLREGQRILSRVLLRKWRQLHEFEAYMIYRRLPTLSLEQRALIDSTLMEMQSLILEAISSAISGKPHIVLLTRRGSASQKRRQRRERLTNHLLPFAPLRLCVRFWTLLGSHCLGNVSPNIGFPLFDCSSVASS